MSDVPVDVDIECPSLRRHFETLYRDEAEPWSYSERGVERLRHERIVDIVRSLAPRRVLDVGCSVGQLTARLAALPIEVQALDVSHTAARRTAERLRDVATPNGCPPGVSCGSATRLPFADETFDALVASDGLYSWHLELADRTTALRQIHRVLARGGHAVFTEHMRPQRFLEFVDEIRAGPLRIVHVEYFHDRPCYQFESWFKAVRHWRIARALRKNLTVARVLCTLGRGFGAQGSRHICVLATRD